MNELREKLIRLAYQKPELRNDLLPLLTGQHLRVSSRFDERAFAEAVMATRDWNQVHELIPLKTREMMRGALSDRFFGNMMINTWRDFAIAYGFGGRRFKNLQKEIKKKRQDPEGKAWIQAEKEELKRFMGLIKEFTKLGNLIKSGWKKGYGFDLSHKKPSGPPVKWVRKTKKKKSDANKMARHIAQLTSVYEATMSGASSDGMKLIERLLKGKKGQMLPSSPPPPIPEGEVA